MCFPALSQHRPRPAPSQQMQTTRQRLWKIRWGANALSFTLTLSGNRVKRCFCALRGWPAQACLLGHLAPDRRASTIKTVKADFDGCHSCKQEAPASVQSMSVFETRPVQQVVAIMMAESWTESEAAQERTRRKYSLLIQTQIVEDGF